MLTLRFSYRASLRARTVWLHEVNDELGIIKVLVSLVPQKVLIRHLESAVNQAMRKHVLEESQVKKKTQMLGPNYFFVRTFAVFNRVLAVCFDIAIESLLLSRSTTNNNNCRRCCYCCCCCFCRSCRSCRCCCCCCCCC